LEELFSFLEFHQLQRTFSRQTTERTRTYRVISNIEEIPPLAEKLEQSKRFAVDTETTSTNPMLAKLVGISFSMQPGEAVYIPFGHDYFKAPVQPDRTEALKILQPVLENSNIKKIGQNIKYDWIVLSRCGIDLKGVEFDTMLASYLINPSKRAHNLDQIALDYLNYKTTTYEEIAGKGKKALGFNRVPLDMAGPYACEDADITLSASRVLSEEMDRLELTDLFNTVEMRLIPVLKRMETTGICVDRDRLGQLSKSFNHQLIQIEENIYTLAGEEFNINSTQQLGHILFEKLNLPVQKKTKKKTGYSTDVSVLTALSEHHDLPALVLSTGRWPN